MRILNLMRMKIELFVLSVASSIQMTVDFGFVAMAVMTGLTLNVQISRVKSMFQKSITVKNVKCEQLCTSVNSCILVYLMSHNTDTCLIVIIHVHIRNNGILCVLNSKMLLILIFKYSHILARCVKS